MKTLIRSFLLVFFITSSITSRAQSIDQMLDQTCANQYMETYQEIMHPGFAQASENAFKNAKKHAEKTKDLKTASSIYRVPVVFHVVYNTTEQNLSDEIIMGQLEVLNQDYRRLNPDADNCRDEFLPVAADTRIEFVLAKSDPDGNGTNGITHTQTDVATFGDIGLDFEQIIAQLEDECGVSVFDLLGGGGTLTPEQEECVNNIINGGGGGGGADPTSALDAVKASATGGVDPWPTQDYLNIWVCNLAFENPLGGGEIDGILGFAYPPAAAPNWPAGSIPADIEPVDGVVLHYRAVGPNNPQAGALAGISDGGRTAVHEVGHYLGLRHIWGDGDCNEDDGMADTPFMDSQSQQDCDFARNTCPDSPTDLPDMVENYMDYSNDACSNTWTTDQSGLMRAMLETERTGLLKTILADFVADKTEVMVGEEIQFSLTSLVNAVEVSWDFGDGNVMDGVEEPMHTYDADGLYTVTLTALNATGDFAEVKSDYILVGDAMSGVEDGIFADVSIYPNPSDGLFILDLPAEANVVVMDVTGKEILRQNDLAGQGNKIDLSQENPGIYFVQIHIDGKSFTQKLILN